MSSAKLLQVSAALSGYDVVGTYANQLPTNWPHLVYVERGAADWAADVLRGVGMRPVVNPSTQQMEIVCDLTSSGVVILRERTLDHSAETYIKSREDAWVDLVFEQRHGYPISVGELRDILHAMANDGISWTRLVRQARRRSLPLQLAPDQDIPLSSEDKSIKALIESWPL